MPLFDFRCAVGHVQERLVAPGTTSTACGCGAPASRLMPIAAPAREQERRIRLSAALEADAEIKHSYQRAGMEPPDLIGVAQRHVAGIRRGKR